MCGRDHTHTHTHTHAHTYIYTHTHTHTHTRARAHTERETQTQMVYCLQVLKTFNNFAAYNRIYIYIREIDNINMANKQPD